jgi:hypothetical protein
MEGRGTAAALIIGSTSPSSSPLLAEREHQQGMGDVETNMYGYIEIKV